jgi:DNA-directed RNA polymerase specialized sigma24 family protein
MGSRSSEADRTKQGQVDRALASLTPVERLVCGWRKAGFSYEEIARHLGEVTSEVERIFANAQGKLRRV